jgi:hypothetical protein
MQKRKKKHGGRRGDGEDGGGEAETEGRSLTKRNIYPGAHIHTEIGGCELPGAH